MLRVASLVLVLLAADADAYLDLGIRQVREGDFEAAVFSLDAAVRGFESKPAARSSLARAHLYLGVAYLSLGNQKLAEARFRRTLEQDPQIKLSDVEFSPRVIRAFENERLKREGQAKSQTGKRVAQIAGGAAVLAAIGIVVGGRGSEAPPNAAPIPTVSVDPSGQFLPWVTIGTFTAMVTDPNGDPVEVEWDFGDGARASGAIASHGFDAEGSFRVVATARDPQGATGRQETSVVVRSLTGSWEYTVCDEAQRYALVQAGASVTGSARFSLGPAEVRATLSSPRAIQLHHSEIRTLCNKPNCSSCVYREGECTGIVSDDLDTISCTVGQGFTLRRK